MKRILLIAAMAVMAMGASAQEKNFIDQSYIEVNGRADLEVTPDEIYLSIVINEADSKNRKPIAQSEREMIAAFKKIGINVEKNLTVSDMTSDLRTYLLKKNAVQTSKAFQLKLDGTAQLSEVFKALADIGIADASISSVDNSNMTELRNEVRAMAVKAAQENARILAEAIGQKAGKAIFIQDYGYSSRPFANVMMAKSTMADGASFTENAPQLDFQKTKIEHSVLVRFVLE